MGKITELPKHTKIVCSKCESHRANTTIGHKLGSREKEKECVLEGRWGWSQRNELNRMTLFSHNHPEHVHVTLCQ